MSECNVCADGVTSLRDKEVYLQELLDQIYTGGRALDTFGRFEEFLRYETLFFDVIPYKAPNGEIYLTYKFKDGLASATDVAVNEDCKVTWIEPQICGNETELEEDAAADQNVIKVKSLKALGGVGAMSNLLITSKESGNPINGLYIQSIDSATNEITLSANLPIELKAGSKVRRGAYLRDRGCGVTIDNTIELGAYDVYSAFFRTVSISHEINACDLNKKYLIDGGAQGIINQRFRKGEAEAAHEIIHAAFYDRNIMIDSRRSETMGLFPALAAAQTNGLKVAYDLEGCCKEWANECEQARIQITAFLDIVFDKAMQSGMFGNKVTVAMNKIARRGLHMMQQHFQDYGNVGFLDGSQYDVNIDMPRIKYAGVEIEFMYLPILDDFDYSIMITMPKDKVGLYQKEYAIVNPNNGLKIEGAPINGTIRGGTPVLRYVNATDDLSYKLGECQKIVWDIDFAVVWQGVDKGAYRVIKNFGKCVLNTCDTCGLEEASFLDA